MHKQGRGFTLIELLISVAIIGIVTAIVVVKYKAFDSTVLLKSAAYEIALTLREMQVHSVSAMRHDNNNFDNPYGVTFTPYASGGADGKTYKVFEFTSLTEDARYDISEPNPDYAKDMSTVTLGRSMRIEDVCVRVIGALPSDPDDCAIDRLDISFKRPEFKALFYAVKGSGNLTAIDTAKILVSSPTNSANVFKVKVTHLGQISVEKQ